MPPKLSKQCKNGPGCSFLKRPGGCMYHHPSEHIPCKNGSTCLFLEKVGGCRFKHDPSPEKVVPPPLFVRIHGLAGERVASSPSGDRVCAYGCGKTTGLTWETCPFVSDIHNTDEWGWRCEECMYEAAMDI